MRLFRYKVAFAIRNLIFLMRDDRRFAYWIMIDRRCLWSSFGHAWEFDLNWIERPEVRPEEYLGNVSWQ